MIVHIHCLLDIDAQRYTDVMILLKLCLKAMCVGFSFKVPLPSFGTQIS